MAAPWQFVFCSSNSVLLSPEALKIQFDDFLFWTWTDLSKALLIYGINTSACYVQHIQSKNSNGKNAKDNESLANFSQLLKVQAFTSCYRKHFHLFVFSRLDNIKLVMQFTSPQTKLENCLTIMSYTILNPFKMQI